MQERLRDLEAVNHKLESELKQNSLKTFSITLSESTEDALKGFALSNVTLPASSKSHEDKQQQLTGDKSWLMAGKKASLFSFGAGSVPSLSQRVNDSTSSLQPPPPSVQATCSNVALETSTETTGIARPPSSATVATESTPTQAPISATTNQPAANANPPAKPAVPPTASTLSQAQAQPKAPPTTSRFRSLFNTVSASFSRETTSSHIAPAQPSSLANEVSPTSLSDTSTKTLGLNNSSRINSVSSVATALQPTEEESALQVQIKELQDELNEAKQEIKTLQLRLTEKHSQPEDTSSTEGNQPKQHAVVQSTEHLKQEAPLEGVSVDKVQSTSADTNNIPHEQVEQLLKAERLKFEAQRKALDTEITALQQQVSTLAAENKKVIDQLSQNHLSELQSQHANAMETLTSNHKLELAKLETEFKAQLQDYESRMNCKSPGDKSEEIQKLEKEKDEALKKIAELEEEKKKLQTTFASSAAAQSAPHISDQKETAVGTPSGSMTTSTPDVAANKSQQPAPGQPTSISTALKTGSSAINMSAKVNKPFGFGNFMEAFTKTTKEETTKTKEEVGSSPTSNTTNTSLPATQTLPTPSTSAPSAAAPADNSNQIDDLNKQLKQAQTRILQLEKDLDAKEGELKLWAQIQKDQAEQHNQQINSLSTKLQNTNTQLEDKKKQLDQANTKLTNVHTTLTNMQKQVDEFKIKADLAQQELIASRAANTTQSQYVQETQTQLKQLAHKYEEKKSVLKNLEKKVEELEGEKSTHLQNISDLQLKVSDLTSQLTSTEKQLQQVSVKCDELEQGHQQEAQEIGTLRRSLEDKDAEIRIAERKQQNLIKDLQKQLAHEKKARKEESTGNNGKVNESYSDSPPPFLC
jgi:predicted  nucleic acid-binding Zn-ribbon protein